MHQLLNNNGKSPPRVAVVGMGYWGQNLVRVFHGLGALAAVCDTNGDIESQAQTKYPLVRFTQDFSTLLSDPEINALAIATPALTHYEMVKAALEAGKDVMIEKPLAIEVRQGSELAWLAQSANRILMVGHILRYHPAVLKLGALIESGTLGQIQYIYSNRLNIGKIRTEENILWSFAPHDISVILSLLKEFPTRVHCQGGAYLNRNVHDVTLSQLDFASGVQAHIFVSWLHPIKEQRLVVVGSEKMAVFDDTATEKLVLYSHRIEWKNRIPTAIKAQGEVIACADREPLEEECSHFLACIAFRTRPLTDAEEGLKVLTVLDACQRSLLQKRTLVELAEKEQSQSPAYFAHESAYVDNGARVGAGTKIWHFSHLMKGALVGEGCSIGQNVNIDGDTRIGAHVKIQNNVSVYSGTVIEDDVFLGPSCVLTNVINPRSQINRHTLYEPTLIKRGATIGANATILCGVTIGAYAFVGAGAVVTRNVPDYALVVGNPGRVVGWMSRHGHRLKDPDSGGIMRCPESGLRYAQTAPGILRCLDLAEDAPLPLELSKGNQSYRDLLNR